MRFIIDTPADLIKALEGRIRDCQNQQLCARTQKQSIALGGEMRGIQEAIFYIGEYAKTLQEKEAQP